MREVPIEQAQQFADYHNLLFLETSSKTGYNVEKTFTQLATRIYDLLEEGKFRIEENWDGIKNGYMQSNVILPNPYSRPAISLTSDQNGTQNNADGSKSSDSEKKSCC